MGAGGQGFIWNRGGASGVRLEAGDSPAVDRLESLGARGSALRTGRRPAGPRGGGPEAGRRKCAR